MGLESSLPARTPVITGVGIVAAPGLNVHEVWAAIVAGNSGLKPLTLFQSPRYGQVLTGEVQHDLVKLGAATRGSRSDRLGWLAAEQAITGANLDFAARGER